MSDLHAVQGKVLGCWCKPRDCHGDILVELVRERYGLKLCVGIEHERVPLQAICLAQ